MEFSKSQVTESAGIPENFSLSLHFSAAQVFYTVKLCGRDGSSLNIDMYVFRRVHTTGIYCILTGLIDAFVIRSSS